MSERLTPETDAIVRNAATADHPPTRLAATLTVKCEKLERERDDARKQNAKLLSIAERAIDDLLWFYESKADGIILELEQLKKETK